jgi:hypothetical protein
MLARDGPVIEPVTIESFAVSEASPKMVKVRNSRKVSVSRTNTTAQSGKLKITKTRQAGQECWTIKTGKRGEKRDDFRVRLADSGFRVVLSFYDTNGVRRERYCCYLSAQEWREAKRKSLTSFVHLIVSKVDARYSAGDLDAARYQEIAPRLAVIA